MKEEKEHNYNNKLPTKLLSFATGGRNDNYLGNFKYRLTTCLNYLARNLKDLGRLNDVEIMITDWNSEVPLSKVLSLSPEAGQICRFVYVPPAVAHAVQKQNQVYYASCAINVSLRRAQGKFLMIMGADTLVPRYSLQMLLDFLDGKITVPFELDRSIFFCRRQIISWEVVYREPSLEEWDRYLLLNNEQLLHEPIGFGLGSCTGGQLMHRSLWDECQGCNEQLYYWGWSDVELALRVTQHYPWAELSGVGVSMLEMEAYKYNLRTWDNNVYNPSTVSPAFVVNDENWGLKNYNFDILSAENIVEYPKRQEQLGAIIQVASWNKTKRELISELSKRSIREHAEKIIRGMDIDLAEWESACALSWYSLHCYPATYLEFGIRKLYSSAIVAAVCTGVEIYGIDSWQTSNSQKLVHNPNYLDEMLRRVYYRGYLRLLSGEPATAFQRLKKSSIGKLWLNLILVRGDIIKTDIIQQLSDLVQYLTCGGMIVFTTSVSDDFQNVWRDMQTRFPQFTYLKCKSRRTGLILAVSLKENKLNLDSTWENNSVIDFGKLLPTRLARQLRRAYRLLRNPRKYISHIKRYFISH